MIISIPKTIIFDLTSGGYRKLIEYPYVIDCRVGELIDFTKHTQYDDDLYKVLQVIHLPNESSKIVEVKITKRVPE